MITGQVTADLVPIAKLVLVGLNGREEEIEAEIDTGFNGYLPATLNTIEALGWQFKRFSSFTLADDSKAMVNVYRGIVMWHGVPRIIDVASSVGWPLIGTGLLDGNRLTSDFKSGGTVTITPCD